MKSLVLLLAFGLVATEKLDRTYLPPPGSKYAGGEPGDLQVPLEFPKQAYTTTAPFTPKPQNVGFTDGDTRLVPGSGRGPGTTFSGSKVIVPVTPDNKPFNYFQNKVPTTTTSYAFTQTTTFPPSESFETTPSPNFPSDGALGEQTGFINQPINQGQINQQIGQIRPGFAQPGGQFSQRPGLLPNAGSNVSGITTSGPGGQIVGQPGFTQPQNINQFQQGVPVSTVSPIPGSSFQPGSVISSPYDQGYTQHLGVQPPRLINQQGFFPSSTAAPNYQTPLQFDNVPNIQGSQVFGQQSPAFSTVGPQQGITQYIDKYGNVQSTVAPGLIVPQQIRPSQGSLPQTSLPQYGGDLNSIPGISGSIISPQGIQRPILNGQQGTFSPNVGPQGTNVNGLIPNQAQGSQLPQISGQQGIYQSSDLSQANVPVLPGNLRPQQQGGQSQQLTGQQGYIPGQQGVITAQGTQFPEFVNQQSNFPSEGYSQVNLSQRPDFANQQNINTPFGISQVRPTLQQNLEGQQPQNIGRLGTYPSTALPGQITGQQGGLPTLGQNGAPLPGQVNYQIPGGQGLQVTGQQSSFPSTGNTQGSAIFGQTNSQLGDQQPRLNEPSFPSTGISNGLPTNSQLGFYQPGDNLNNIEGSITPAPNSLPDQQQILGTQQGSVPFGPTQTTDSRLPPQQSVLQRPGQQNIITSGPQNIFRPGATGPSSPLPSSNQQTFSPSITPSSTPSYGTTPGINYPTSTSSYLSSNPFEPLSERPQAESDRNAVILNYENILTPEGFAYSFDTSNGIHADENGTAIDGVKANGSYSYVGDDGKLYSVVYTADENGFRPHGDHLPTPPPIPKAIQRVIEQAEKDKEAGISHDGFYNEEKYGHKKYHGPKHHRPGMQATIVNGADIPDDYESTDDNVLNKKMFLPNEDRKDITSTDDEETLKEYDDARLDDNDNITEINEDGKVQKFPSRRPTNKKPEQFDYQERRPQQMYKGQKAEQRRPFNPQQDSPRRRPSSSNRKDKPLSSDGQYKDVQIYDDEDSLETGGGYSNKPTQGSFDENRRIPSKEAGSKYTPGRLDAKEQTPVRKIQESKRPGSSSTRFENNYNFMETVGQGSRPQKPIKGPSKNFSTKYSDTDDDQLEEQNDYQESDLPERGEQQIIGRPKGTKKMGSTKTRKGQRPGSSTQENTFANDNNTKDSRSEEKGKPSYDEHTVVPSSNYPKQSDDEETGYQYEPPQNKFDPKGTNRFPSRFSEKTTPRPSFEKYNISDKKATVQPFITPNVYRNDDENYEDGSEENIPSRKPEKVSEYFDKESETPQYGIDEEVTSSKFRPDRPQKIGSNQRPGYQIQQTKGKPQYYDEYENEEEKDSKRPGQNINRYPSGSGKPTTFVRPEQNYSQQSRVESKKPVLNYVSSTTSMPPRKFSRPDSRPSQQDEEEDQYTNIYKPSDTLSPEEEYTEGKTEDGISTTKSGSRRPVTIPGDFSYVTAGKNRPASTKMPSSRPTSQLSHDYSEKTTALPGSPTIRPGISESAFDRTSMRPVSSKKPSYSSSKSDSETSRPDSTSPDGSDSSVDKYYNRNKPGSVTISSESKLPDRTISASVATRPTTSQTFSQFGRQDLPSTTYRPNYSITDISRPGLVTVDSSGRPQAVLDSGRPTTAGISRPGFSVSPGQETPPTEQSLNDYQDSGAISSGHSTFKPTEPRFGGVQGIAGQKPAEFGPSSITTPGYLSPYGAPGKVIGEDFSGPKQQQKYDPETGYYY